jgi:transcriptional regulator with XRE-family HTH domain
MEGTIYSATSEVMTISVPVESTSVARSAFNRSPLVIGAALACLALGTGGSLTPSYWVELGRRTRSTNIWCEVSRVSESSAVSEEALLTVQERLAAIQHYFSLNIKELAEILHVSRPTIYSWLRMEQQPQPANLTRIRELYELTRLWLTISIKPIGNWIRTPLSSGQKLVHLFSEEYLNNQTISAAFNMIGTLVEKAEDTKTQITAGRNSKKSMESEQELLSQEFGI